MHYHRFLVLLETWIGVLDYLRCLKYFPDRDYRDHGAQKYENTPGTDN